MLLPKAIFLLVICAFIGNAAGLGNLLGGNGGILGGGGGILGGGLGNGAQLNITLTGNITQTLNNILGNVSQVLNTTSGDLNDLLAGISGNVSQLLNATLAGNLTSLLNTTGLNVNQILNLILNDTSLALNITLAGDVAQILNGVLGDLNQVLATVTVEVNQVLILVLGDVAQVLDFVLDDVVQLLNATLSTNVTQALNDLIANVSGVLNITTGEVGQILNEISGNLTQLLNATDIAVVEQLLNTILGDVNQVLNVLLNEVNGILSLLLSEIEELLELILSELNQILSIAVGDVNIILKLIQELLVTNNICDFSIEAQVPGNFSICALTPGLTCFGLEEIDMLAQVALGNDQKTGQLVETGRLMVGGLGFAVKPFVDLINIMTQLTQCCNVAKLTGCSYFPQKLFGTNDTLIDLFVQIQGFEPSGLLLSQLPSSYLTKSALNCIYYQLLQLVACAHLKGICLDNWSLTNYGLTSAGQLKMLSFNGATFFNASNSTCNDFAQLANMMAALSASAPLCNCKHNQELIRDVSKLKANGTYISQHFLSKHKIKCPRFVSLGCPSTTSSSSEQFC